MGVEHTELNIGKIEEKKSLLEKNSSRSDSSRQPRDLIRDEAEKKHKLLVICNGILNDINTIDYDRYTDVLKNVNIIRRDQKIEGFMEERKDPLADFMEKQKDNPVKFMEGYKNKVAQFIENHKNAIINYISNKIYSDDLRVEGESTSAKSSVASHLRNYIYSEFYNNKKDDKKDVENAMKIVAWLDYQQEIYDLKKKLFAIPREDHTKNLDNNKQVKQPEFAENKKEQDSDPTKKAIEQTNKEVDPKVKDSDKNGDGTTPQNKPESKFRKLMRNALKKIWDVMKRPIKFLARKTLDGIAFFPYKLVRLMAKGTWHEMRKHPGKFTAIMVGLNILCSVGMAPYLLHLAHEEYKREKQAREGTQSPVESRSWPARAHQLINYRGLNQKGVNHLGKAMLRMYERLENKDKSKKSDTDDSDGTSDSLSKGKSKPKKGSGTSGPGETDPSPDMSGDQYPQGQTPPEGTRPSSMSKEYQRQISPEMTLSNDPGYKKPKRSSWRSTLGNILKYGYPQSYYPYSGTQPYNQNGFYPWQSSSQRLKL